MRVRTFLRPIVSVCAAAVWLAAVSAAAQTDAPPLTSNRPGIGESEALVVRGAIQLESGMQVQSAPPGSDRAWTETWGQLNVRVGVSRRVELFVGWDGLSLDRIQRSGQSVIVAGGNDLRIGAKVAILSEDRHGLTLTVAPAWSFPVGADEFSSGTHEGSLRLMWARSLPHDWSVSGNVLFTRTRDDAGRYWDNGATVGVTRALTQTVSAFVETSGVLLAMRPDAWTVDGGVAWIARRDLQLDVSAGHTFSDRGDPWFVSAGVTLRHRSR